MTTNLCVITPLDVLYWTASTQWTAERGSITGNIRGRTKVAFPAMSTRVIRVVVSSSLTGCSRLTEIETWGIP